MCACFLCDPLCSPINQFVSMQGACVSLWCVSVCVSVLLHGAFPQPPTESDSYTVRMGDPLSFPVLFILHVAPSRSDQRPETSLSSLPIHALMLLVSCNRLDQNSRKFQKRFSNYSRPVASFPRPATWYRSEHLSIVTQRLGLKEWLLSRVLCPHASSSLSCRNAQTATTGTHGRSTAKVTAPLSPFDRARFLYN